MISFFEISSYLQLDFAKLKFMREGYTYLKASDMLPADLINIASSNDMFAPQSDYLIDLDKASAKNYEGVINSVSGSNNLVILGFKLDKRSSVYAGLKKHIDKNSDLSKLFQNPQNLISEYLNAKYQVKLIFDTGYSLGDEDLIVQEVVKLLPSIDEKEIKFSEIKDRIISAIDSKAVFDTALALITGSGSNSEEAVNSATKNFGAESVWNTLIWYGDMASRLLSSGGDASSAGVSSYVATKLSRINRDHLINFCKFIVEAELKFKSGKLAQQEAIYYALSRK
jgi:hypothetical protein